MLNKPACIQALGLKVSNLADEEIQHYNKSKSNFYGMLKDARTIIGTRVLYADKGRDEGMRNKVQ